MVRGFDEAIFLSVRSWKMRNGGTSKRLDSPDRHSRRSSLRCITLVMTEVGMSSERSDFTCGRLLYGCAVHDFMNVEEVLLIHAMDRLYNRDLRR